MIDDEDDSSDKHRNSADEDLNVDSIDVTPSPWGWLDGKGLVKDAVIKGVRGILDRRSVRWSPDLDPASFRHIAQQDDFELESLTLEDVLVTVYQPGGFRPYTFPYSAQIIGTLRTQWLFYDFLKAEGIVGRFSNCLFIARRALGERTNRTPEWSTMSRFRIDGVNIDHLQAMTTEEGPISGSLPEN